MNRYKAGLTLLEIVLAIALVGSLVAGTGWWARESAKRAVATSDLVQSEAALDALVEAIAADLSFGDFGASTAKVPKATVVDGVLTIRSRSSVESLGAIAQSYAHKPMTRELVVNERVMKSDPTRTRTPSGQVVLGGVTRFDATIDERQRILKVEIALENGANVARRWSLP